MTKLVERLRAKAACIRLAIKDDRVAYAHSDDANVLDEAAAALSRAEATVTAWSDVVGGIEAHIQDRIAMGDEANPQTYLEIIQANVSNVTRSSEQMIASRWACEKRLRDAADRAEAQRDALAKALASVNKLIAEAAMTGFNCHDGDWAQRLYDSQQETSRALAAATDMSATAVAPEHRHLWSGDGPDAFCVGCMERKHMQGQGPPQDDKGEST